ncbi:hypothetical protein D3C80_1254710 [compost metagenome]
MHRQPAHLIAQPFRRAFHRILSRIERNADRKLAAHARFGIDRNIAIHHADQLFANGQPQPGPLEVTLHPGSHLEERIEQFHHLFCRNTDASIADTNA